MPATAQSASSCCRDHQPWSWCSSQRIWLSSHHSSATCCPDSPCTPPSLEIAPQPPIDSWFLAPSPKVRCGLNYLHWNTIWSIWSSPARTQGPWGTQVGCWGGYPSALDELPLHSVNFIFPCSFLLQKLSGGSWSPACSNAPKKSEFVLKTSTLCFPSTLAAALPLSLATVTMRSQIPGRGDDLSTQG